MSFISSVSLFYKVAYECDTHQVGTDIHSTPPQSAPRRSGDKSTLLAGEEKKKLLLQNTQHTKRKINKALPYTIENSKKFYACLPTSTLAPSCVVQHNSLFISALFAKLSRANDCDGGVGSIEK